MVESVVLLPFSTDDKTWTIGEWDIDQNHPKLQDIFLQYLLVETENRGDLEELDEQISLQEEILDDNNMEYSQATINKFKNVCNRTLNEIRKMRIDIILNSMPYDRRVKEEINKINDGNQNHKECRCMGRSLLSKDYIY